MAPWVIISMKMQEFMMLIIDWSWMCCMMCPYILNLRDLFGLGSWTLHIMGLLICLKTTMMTFQHPHLYSYQWLIWIQMITHAFWVHWIILLIMQKGNRLHLQLHLIYHSALKHTTGTTIYSKLKQIVLILGCFHTQMTYLGAIGNLMENTGLQHMLEWVFAANSVPHILNGKATARAFRAHMLGSSALTTMTNAAAFKTTICVW